LYEKVRKLYPRQEIRFLVRPLLEDLTKEKYPEIKVNEINKSNKTSLFISARAILKQKISLAGPEQVFINKEDELIGFRVQNKRINQLPTSTKTIFSLNLPKKQVKAISIKYLWDLVELNSKELIADFPKPANYGKVSTKAVIIGNNKNLYVGKNAEIESTAVIDLRSDPVYIDDDAKILALSKIIGPCYIGKNTIIDMAKISGSTIGENCRISGEVESSIFQGFINKHHYGFIGHSYIGEWVNLGAGTTNSDLKNNYSSVKVELDKKKIDTKLTKVGCFIGDHSKTAIGTMIPTGAVIGVFANVLESAKSIPNFYWSKGKRWQLQKAIETAKIVMSRRNIILSKSYEKLIHSIY